MMKTNHLVDLIRKRLNLSFIETFNFKKIRFKEIDQLKKILKERRVGKNWNN